ncbi:MAG TPA: ATP-binding protein, partial [Myxococcota bacterium]|nr:ATP-binding protein [Myxococcota bacterium]
RVCHTESRWTQMLDRLVHAGELEHHPLLPIGGRMYEATYGRVTGSDGVSLGAVMVARDVTERLREEGLRAERERMATIGKLAAGLAHEINNPLGSIQLYTQHALKRVEGQDPLADHLSTVLRNANVCKKIVRDLLEYARQRPPETRRITAEELVTLTRKTVEPRASSLGVQLVVNVVNVVNLREGENSSNGSNVLDSPTGPSLEVDPDQIVQVLVNLALNGIDAMAGLPPERPRVLTLTIAASKTEVGLTVEDSGDGVSEEHRATIFSPFFTTKSEGTGLGLAVAKDIIRAHGGRLELAPGPGGARFVVTLPRSNRSEVNA